MRTDRTSLCLPCLARFPRGDRCPRCGGEDLVDLCTALGRERARKADRFLRFGWTERLGGVSKRRRSLYWPWTFVAVFVLVSGAALALGEGPLPALLAGLLSAIFVPVVVAVLALVVVTALMLIALLLGIAGLLLRRDPMDWLQGKLFLRIADSPAPPAPPRSAGLRPTRVSGIVRAPDPTTSPLSGEACVGFRLVGRGPSGTVDDADMVAFELVVSGSDTVAVESGPAVLDVPTGTPARTPDPAGALSEFLEQRGVLLEPGPVSVGEGLIRDGDHVEVEGLASADLRPDGYRGSTQKTILRGSPDAPLVIRLITPRGHPHASGAGPHPVAAAPGSPPGPPARHH